MATRVLTRSLAPAAAALALLAAASCTDRTPTPEPGGEPSWPTNQNYPGVGTGRLVVTNNWSDTLTIIDMESFDPVMVLPVGLNPVDLEGPHHIASDHLGEYYYMALSQNVSTTGSGPHGAHGSGVVPGYAVKFRASDNAMVGRVRIDRNPGDVVVTSDNKRVLVSHFDLLRVSEALLASVNADPPLTPAELYKKTRSAVAILDADRMDLDGNGLLSLVYVCPSAHGIRLSPDSRYAYMSCLSSDELAVIDLEHPDIYSNDPSEAVTLHYVGSEDGKPNASPSYEAPSYSPYAVAVSPADGTVWISCQLGVASNGGEMRVYDPKLGRMDLARTVPLEGKPFFGSFNSDGSRLFMAQQSGDAVVEIDPATSEVASKMRVCAFMCGDECRSFQAGVGPYQCDDPAVPAVPQCAAAHVIEVLPDQQTGVLICEGDYKANRPGTALHVSLDPLTIDKTLVVDKYPDGVAIVRAP